MDILNGWTLTILGIFVAFLAMATFVVVIIVLKAIFPYKPEAVEEEEPAEAVETSAVPTTSSIEAEVAAIAVAIAAARQKKPAPIGANLLNGRSAWWAANRMAAQQSNGLKRR